MRNILLGLAVVWLLGGCQGGMQGQQAIVSLGLEQEPGRPYHLAFGVVRADVVGLRVKFEGGRSLDAASVAGTYVVLFPLSDRIERLDGIDGADRVLVTCSVRSLPPDFEELECRHS
jgi:hypothetical protein